MSTEDDLATDDQEVENQSAEDEVNYLALSDEELLNLPEPGSTAPDVEAVEADEADPADKPEGAPAAQDGEDADDTDDTDSGQAGTEATGDAKDTAAEAEGEKAAGDEGEKPDYEKLYNDLISPFKANGREIKVDNIEDARRLMQMGANYNKKMSAMKPHLKTLKLLENNGLLDEQKLSFYIDLEQKKPEAIAKLLKDSKIDPLDLDLEKDDYKASTYTVDDREIELDSVLDELKDSAQYPQLLETVSTKWDTASQQAIGREPQILRVIHDHMSSGVYGVITQEMDRQKMLGQLNGVPDLAAYRQVGEAIQAKGGFNHLFQQSTGTEATEKQEIQPKAKSEDKALASKRKAARATKSISAPQHTDGYNPLSMSDEEFEKRFDSRLM